MAAGDPVIETGSTSGGSATTITVPSGQVWVVSSWGSIRDDMQFEADDGTVDPVVAAAETTTAANAGGEMRQLFDDTVDPKIRNNTCSSVEHYVGGREI